MKTLTLPKPLNPSRRKPRQRITRAEIMASAVNTEAVQPVKDVDQDEHGGTPKKIAKITQIKFWLKKKYSPIDKCIPLALGSHKEILKDRDGLWSYHRTVAAIRQLTRRKKYLKALTTEGAVRYRLDGSVDEPVSEDLRRHARRLRDQRTKKKRLDVSRGVNESSDRDSSNQWTENQNRLRKSTND